MELVALAKNPVPSGAHVAMLTADDGVQLRTARWEASRGPRRGTVCLFGGRTEYIEKYFEVVADLRRRGFAVATMDWRGQGGSDRLLPNRHKGHVRDFKEYDRDVVRFMRDVVLPDCPPPYIALAHSMGGNVLLRAARTPGTWFERMVLCAPMVRLAREGLGLPSAVARTAAESTATAGLGWLYVPGGTDAGWESQPFEGNVLTSSRDRYERNQAIVKAEPRLSLGAPTFGWMRAALRSMALVSSARFASEVYVPILFVAAGDDAVVDSRAIEQIAVRIKMATYVLIPGARHEVLQEAEDIRRQFWAAFDAYVGIIDEGGA
ncbi:MAG: alpha/beta fold hydrolase [Rhizobiales bacterium]|nr:alpha/beta fold hydrolase [Hyphomicrobiales bacterium]